MSKRSRQAPKRKKGKAGTRQHAGGLAMLPFCLGVCEDCEGPVVVFASSWANAIKGAPLTRCAPCAHAAELREAVRQGGEHRNGHD
jgi:hypothetical protein